MLTLRIDLDYVPWDSPDATEFGHGEPAMILKLLELARTSGQRFQFYASNRVLRAFPAAVESVLNEGHDLDWFSKHPEEQDGRFEEAIDLFRAIGHQPLGMCIRGQWPAEAEFPNPLTFLSSSPGSAPKGIRHFPVDLKSDRDAARNGVSARNWTDTIKVHIRDVASRNKEATVCVRPQVLAKFDPKLGHVKEIMDLARAVGMPIRTHRQAASPVDGKSEA